MPGAGGWGPSRAVCSAPPSLPVAIVAPPTGPPARLAPPRSSTPPPTTSTLAMRWWRSWRWSRSGGQAGGRAARSGRSAAAAAGWRRLAAGASPAASGGLKLPATRPSLPPPRPAPPRRSGSAKPRAAAFACAGPVRQGRCEMTNLGWTIDAGGLLPLPLLGGCFSWGLLRAGAAACGGLLLRIDSRDRRPARSPAAHRTTPARRGGGAVWHSLPRAQRL